MPELSIIVPTLDPGREFGWEEKMAAADIEVELLVCTEGSASAARNEGIREADADKLVFLDDDSVPQGEYFDHVAELLDEYPAVTGPIRDTGSTVTRGLSSQYDQGSVGHPTETVVGCNMAIRRDVLNDVGTFDERLPYGHEETELTDRICESYTVWYDPELTVEHPFADSLSDYLEKQYRHGRESIPYYEIRDADVHKQMAKFIFVPSHYIDSTVRRTALATLGQVVSNIGMLQGYVQYKLKDTRPADTMSSESDAGTTDRDGVP
ncbi:glycosyltransferase family 2 protein [Haloarcula salina]|uniref:Glycosyltransferase n=1 Tax=Haloarcula salina TaxID=1429914 RepID=A0AA41G1M1_9EURY|nr:glycosyltransferase [Haloarcula salina]MBV0902732.1 glycosyltransferase [Haloarcula salina]